MPVDWLPALASGIGVFLALEVPFWLLRRQIGRLILRFLYHVWALSVGAVAVLIYGQLLLFHPRAWHVAGSAAIVLSGFVLWLFLDLLLSHQRSGERTGPLVPKLARDLIGWAIVVAGALTAATQMYDLSLTSALVTSTVLSAVVGLALQDVLKHLFAGIALQMEGGFTTGDWLLIDGQPAQVVEMSWRMTRLRTNEGVEFIEPNGKMAEARLINYGSGATARAWGFAVGLPYEVPPHRVEHALLAAARSAPGAVEEPAPQVFLRRFGDSSIDYQLRVWTRRISELSRFIDDVNSRIWYQLQRDGISIPFPIRSVQIRSLSEIEHRREGEERSRALEHFSRIDLFAALDHGVLERLAAAAHREQFEHGERLVSEGEQGDSLFVIDRGRVAISKSGRAIGTGTIDLATLKEGDFFGEMSLLTGEPRSATVTSAGGCEVLVLSKAAVAPLIAADPAIAETLSQILATRVAATQAVIEDRRDRPRAAAPQTDAASFLNRIRAFFKLSARGD